MLLKYVAERVVSANYLTVRNSCNEQYNPRDSLNLRLVQILNPGSVRCFDICERLCDSVFSSIANTIFVCKIVNHYIEYPEVLELVKLLHVQLSFQEILNFLRISMRMQLRFQQLH